MDNWLDIKGHVVIVTGGSSGIGRAIVANFLKCGAIVYNFDLNNFHQSSEQYHYIQVNVSERYNVQQAVQQVVEKHGKIDTLINNAGINLPRLLFDYRGDCPKYQMNEEDLDKMLNVNLKGPVWCAQEVVQHQIKSGIGTIINIASEAGQEGSEGQSIYAATKAALIGFTRSWAKELGKHGIRVVALAPGILEDTGLRTKAYEEALAYTRDTTVEKVNSDYSKSIPIRRVGKLEEVADLVVYLSSKRSSYVTGTTINISGGKSRG